MLHPVADRHPAAVSLSIMLYMGLNPGWGGLQEEKNRQSYSERYKKKTCSMYDK